MLEIFENEVDTLEEFKENKKRLQTERERILSEIDKIKNLVNRQTKKSSSEVSTQKDMLVKVRGVYEAISNPDIDCQTKGLFIRSILEDIVYDKENKRLLFHFYYS